MLNRSLPILALLLGVSGFIPTFAQTTAPPLGFTPTGPATVVGGPAPSTGTFATLSAMSAAEAQITSLQSLEAALQANQNVATALNQALQGTVTQVQANISTLQNQVLGLQTNVGSLQTSVTALQAQGGVPGSGAAAPTGFLAGSAAGLIGDNHTNNNGAFSTLMAANVPIFLSDGCFQITSPLTPTLPSSQGTNPPGLVLEANRPSIQGLVGGVPGTCIEQVGENQDSVLYFKGASGNFRDARIDHIEFKGNPDGSTTNLLHIDGATWTGLSMDGDRFNGADTAICVTPGANGEDFDFHHLFFSGVRRIYANSSGQSLTHNFWGVYGSLNNGCTCFELGSGVNPEFQFSASGLDITCGGGSSPNTFFQDDGSTGTVEIGPGRVENDDTLLSYGSYSTGTNGTIHIHDIVFSGCGTRGGPLVISTNTTNNAQYTIVIENCIFQALSGATPPTIALSLHTGEKSRIIFRHCIWTGWADATSVTTTTVSGQHGGVLLDDCYRTTVESNILTPFN